MKKLVSALTILLASFAASASSLPLTSGGLTVSAAPGAWNPANISFSGYNGDPARYTGTYNKGILGTLNAVFNGMFDATYLGSEAADTNSFSFTTGAQQLTKRSAVGTTISTSVNAGVVGFEFVDATAADYARVVNGIKATNYYASFAVLDANKTVYVGGTRLNFDYILGFNDGYKSDADYDDFVVGVKLKAAAPPRPPSAVPLPAAAWLFGSALFGFVAVSNRRKV